MPDMRMAVCEQHAEISHPQIPVSAAFVSPKKFNMERLSL